MKLALLLAARLIACSGAVTPVPDDSGEPAYSNRTDAHDDDAPASPFCIVGGDMAYSCEAARIWTWDDGKTPGGVSCAATACPLGARCFVVSEGAVFDGVCR